MEHIDVYVVREGDLLLLQEALADFEKELNQLEKTHEWYVSDSRALLSEARAILHNILEIEYDEQAQQDREFDDWEREAERIFAELCIEREGADSYWSEDEDEVQ